MDYSPSCSNSCSSSSPSPMNPSSQAEGTRRVVRKFTLADDIALLSEVCVQEDPFCRPVTSDCWSKIARALGENNDHLVGITGRACKERAEKLVRQGRSKDNWKARQSGTDEMYGEKERVMQEAIELFEEKERKRKQGMDDKTKHGEEYALAARIRDDAMRTLGQKRRHSHSDDELEQGLFPGEEDDLDPASNPNSKEKRRRRTTPVEPAKSQTSATEHLIYYLEKKEERRAEARMAVLALERERRAEEDRRRAEEEKQRKEELKLEREVRSRQGRKAGDAAGFAWDRSKARELALSFFFFFCYHRCLHSTGLSLLLLLYIYFIPNVFTSFLFCSPLDSFLFFSFFSFLGMLCTNSSLFLPICTFLGFLAFFFKPHRHWNIFFYYHPTS